jgi:hypothetical protein
MSPVSGTLGDLVSEMHGAGALTQGWNVILSVREQALARAAQSHWAAQVAPPGAQPLSVQWHAEDGAAHQVQLDLAPPAVRIGDRPNALSVSLPVRSASRAQGRVANGAAAAAAGTPLASDAAVSWGAQQSLPAGATIEGSAPLRVIPTAPDTVSVVLDMGAGSFRMAGSAPQDLAQEHFGNGLAASFAAQQPHLPVLSVKLPAAGALAGLRTDTTRMATLPSSGNGDGVLQTFFAKSPAPSDAPALGLSAPIPADADYSMIVDSQTFVTELVSAFNGTGSTGQPRLAAADPDGTTGIWYATIASPMQYQGTISYRNDGVADITNQATMGLNFKGSPSGELVLSTYITQDSNIQMGLTLAAQYSVETSAQQIRMQSGASSVAAVGMVENVVKARLQQFLGVDIAGDMNTVDLQAPAQLLLQGLQVPGHQVRLGQAKLPGDLVVVGTLEAQPS